MPSDLFNSLQSFELAPGKTGKFYSLPQLEKEGVGPISKLPVSIRVVLESVLRNYDGAKITEEDVRALANWQPNATRTEEIPFVVARVLLQDFTGVPLLVDLAAMRSAVARLNKNTGVIEPLVPVDLVIDHSVQVDFASSKDSFTKNMEMEFKRNNSATILEVGHAGLRWVWSYPRHWYLSPGEPRVSRQDGLGTQRVLLSIRSSAPIRIRP